MALLVAATLGLVGAAAGTASGDEMDATPEVFDLTFPVADPDDGVYFSDSFHAPRSGGRLHGATDLMAPKHRAVHAAVGGTISHAPYPEPGYGWMLSIRGDDGRRYSYIHLNNDTPERNDSGAWLDDDNGGIEHAYAPRIARAVLEKGSSLYSGSGVRVERGELIGWLGDSGNAKGVGSHLHFEIYEQDGDGGEIRRNPYDSLVAARERGDIPGSTQAAATFDGMFLDVDPDGTHGPAIERLAEQDIVHACDGERYCPADAVTRGDLAVSLAAVSPTVTTVTSAPSFPDVETDDERAEAIAQVNAAGILTGYADGTFGPEDPLTRAQLASVLVRTFEVPPADDDAPFTDVVPGHTHSDTIAATAEAGLTVGCADGTRYCGKDPVTRGQIATFLDRGRTEFS